MAHDDKITRAKDDLKRHDNIELQAQAKPELELDEKISGLGDGVQVGRAVVYEPPPFRFFGTRIREAVRVIKG